MSNSYGTIRKVYNKWCFHNILNSVSDEPTKFLNQRETFSQNQFHFDFVIYIWS